MRARHWIIAVAAWLISSAVCAPRACDAGFLPTNLAVQSLADGDDGSMALADSRLESDEPVPTPELAAPDPASIPDGGSSSSSNGAARVVGAGVVALVPDRSQLLTLSAADRLQVRESLLIPAVYLSRVFRPPRV